MEYRLKYRDIPWPVAIGVLPGKIIGTFLIKPWLKFRRTWKRAVRILLVLLMMLIITMGMLTIVDYFVGGAIRHKFKAVFFTQEPAIVDLATPASITGNVH